MNTQEINTFLKENDGVYLYVECQSFTKFQIFHFDGIFYIYMKNKGQRKFHKLSLTGVRVSPLISYIKANEAQIDERYLKIREGINFACFKSTANDNLIGEYFNTIE